MDRIQVDQETYLQFLLHKVITAAPEVLITLLTQTQAAEEEQARQAVMLVLQLAAPEAVVQHLLSQVHQ